MDIEKVVQEKFSEILSSGFIEEKIKDALKKTVADAVESALRSYSDFGKKIEAALKESVSRQGFDLPDYNQLVSNWVLEMVEKSMIQVGRAQIEANLKDFFKPLEKDEWTVSEIVEEFKKSIMEDDEQASGEITCIIQESESYSSTREYWAIYLDDKKTKEKYKCKYQIHVNNNGVWRVEIDGEDSQKAKSICYYGFDEFVFKLYSNKVKITNDENNVSTEYGHEYD